ncbi:MAG: energy-coupling factor transporter transmembrane protein EcfT [Proteobacteria bacterium]|nr:energy-coupling factor transporter transmembrane protein EcfT [Pseudomonadota bacterium]
MPPPHVRHPYAQLAFLLPATTASLLGPMPALGCLALFIPWALWVHLPLKRWASRFLPALSGFGLLALLALSSPWGALQLATIGAAVAAFSTALPLVVPLSAVLSPLGRLPHARSLVIFFCFTAKHMQGMAIRLQQRFWALQLRGGFARRRWRGIRLLLVGFLPEVFQKADTLAWAMQLRGFQGLLPPPTLPAFGLRETPPIWLGLGAIGWALWGAGG